MLNYFYVSEKIFIESKGLFKSVEPQVLLGQRATKDVKDPKTGDVIIKKGRKFLKSTIKKIDGSKIEKIPVEVEDLLGRFIAEDIVDPKTGEILVECNNELTKEKLDELNDKGIKRFPLVYIGSMTIGSYIRDTLVSDKVGDSNEALKEIYSKLRPGDPATPEAAKKFFDNLFFNPERYNLSKVGRLKLNKKLRC